MKQPELGKKIAELRKTRGLTQEELVEKCNINVRTIQRIETGEVTPRDYTIRTILEAMDYDFSEIANEKSINVIRYLQIAAIAGIAYFIVGFPESILEIMRMSVDSNALDIPGIPYFDFDGYDVKAYVIVKVLALVSYSVFIYGFVLIGNEFKNTVLKVIALLLLVGTFAMITYDIASAFYDSSERILLLPGFSVSFGGMGIVFGAALIKLNQQMGVIGLIAGIFEIIAGLFFLIVIPIGFFFLIPAELCEIILLFKAAEMLKKQES